MTLNIQQIRNGLVELVVPMHRKDTIDKLRNLHALGSSAEFMVTSGFQCCLVGLFHDAREIFVKALDYVREAIKIEEIPNHYFPVETEAYRFRCLSLCEWFVSGQH